MSIVNIQDVRVANFPDPNKPNQQIPLLSYLNRQYELVRVFPDRQLTLAQGLWQHLDNGDNACLIVREPQQYSIWLERKIDLQPVRSIEVPPAKETPSERLQSPQLLDNVFRAQLCLIEGLWSEVRELMGTNQSAIFGSEILAIIPTIAFGKDLLATIAQARQLDFAMGSAEISTQQLQKIYQEIHRLGEKYLGKSYSTELLSDLQAGLPAQLRKGLQVWLNTNEYKN